jgi:hypothetical protein
MTASSNVSRQGRSAVAKANPLENFLLRAVAFDDAIDFNPHNFKTQTGIASP